MFPAPKQSSVTTLTWAMWIEVTSCAAITAAAQRAVNFINTFFYFLFDTTITNSFILWKTFGSATRMTLKEFRLRLAQQLIGDYCSRRKPGRAGGPVRTLPLRHFPLKLDDDTTGANKRGRCVRCLQVHHKRTDTTWFCRECQEWLCHSGTSTGDCFLLWHKNRT